MSVCSQAPNWCRFGAGCRWDETWFSFACATSPGPGSCSHLKRLISQSSCKRDSWWLCQQTFGWGEVGDAARPTRSSPDVTGCEVTTQLPHPPGPAFFFYSDIRAPVAWILLFVAASFTMSVWPICISSYFIFWVNCWWSDCVCERYCLCFVFCFL